MSVRHMIHGFQSLTTAGHLQFFSGTIRVERSATLRAGTMTLTDRIRVIFSLLPN